MATYRIRHRTTYRYKSPVALGQHRLMLRPREASDQRITAFDLAIEPRPETLLWSEDPSGNAVALAAFGLRTRSLVFSADVTVDHTAFDGGTIRLPGYAATVPFSYEAEEVADLSRFIERQHPDPEHLLERWLRDVQGSAPSPDTWAFLVHLNVTIRRDFAYLRRDAKGIQPPDQTLRTRRGTCRDFALLMIEAVRQRGVAARFVSGYLRVRSSEPRTAMIGGSTHAWLQVYLPQVGWVDFDPTSGGVGNRDLVRVATVRDPGAAVPVSGSFMGFPSDFIDMAVQVDVSLVEPAPVPNPLVGRSEPHPAQVVGS